MPQPAEVQAAADRIVALFRSAQAEIEQRTLAAATDPATTSRRRRLIELRRSVDAELAALEADTAGWLQGNLPPIYELGAGQAGVNVFTWSQIHVDAVQRLAADTFDDVLVATANVRADAKSWVRAAARRQTALSLIEGRTAQQAAREFTRAGAGEAVDLLGGPIGVIRYADGSYRTLADYADMLLRTKTAQCFNAGTLNQLHGAGVSFVEVLDGADCGWSSHDDGDKANGTVRSVDDANQHSLSHPRCRRSFIGRPDVTTKTQAANAEPSTTEAQRADQAQAEKDRAERIARSGRPRQRPPRQVRTPRPAPTGARAQPTRQPRSPRASRSQSPPPTAPPLSPPPPISAPTQLTPGELPRITDLFNNNERGADLTDALRPVFEQTVDDLHVQLESARHQGNTIGVSGRIMNGNSVVGQVQREIRRSPDGELSVYNAYLSIDKAHQGDGFATEYLGRLEEWYRANDVHHIDVHANIDVGGYTWARKGFNWDYTSGRPDVGTVPAALRREIAGMDPGAERTELEGLLKDLLDPARWATKDSPRPADIANLGRTEDSSIIHRGKRMMLGTSWHGRLIL